MVATALAGGQPQPSPRVLGTGSHTAQVDQRCQILLLLQGCPTDTVVRKDVSDVHIEVGGSELDRVARNDPEVQTVEPARAPVVPGSVLDGHVIVDAVVLRLGE